MLERMSTPWHRAMSGVRSAFLGWAAADVDAEAEEPTCCPLADVEAEAAELACWAPDETACSETPENASFPLLVELAESDWLRLLSPLMPIMLETFGTPSVSRRPSAKGGRTITMAMHAAIIATSSMTTTAIGFFDFFFESGTLCLACLAKSFLLGRRLSGPLLPVR